MSDSDGNWSCITSWMDRIIILEDSNPVWHKVESFVVVHSPILGGGLLDNNLCKIHADMTCPVKCVAYEH